jgi:hypothetical protein
MTKYTLIILFFCFIKLSACASTSKIEYGVVEKYEQSAITLIDQRDKFYKEFKSTNAHGHSIKFGDANFSPNIIEVLKSYVVKFKPVAVEHIDFRLDTFYIEDNFQNRKANAQSAAIGASVTSVVGAPVYIPTTITGREADSTELVGRDFVTCTIGGFINGKYIEKKSAVPYSAFSLGNIYETEAFRDATLDALKKAVTLMWEQYQSEK